MSEIIVNKSAWKPVNSLSFLSFWGDKKRSRGSRPSKVTSTWRIISVSKQLGSPPFFPPWSSAIWKGNNPILRGRKRSSWVLTTCKFGDDPPSSSAQVFPNCWVRWGKKWKRKNHPEVSEMMRNLEVFSWLQVWPGLCFCWDFGGLSVHLSNEKRGPKRLFSEYVGYEILSSFMGILFNHWKDLYYPGSPWPPIFSPVGLRVSPLF